MTQPAKPGWSPRAKFAATVSVIVGAVLLTAHAVMLPFLLAIIVAYVLTPLVTRFEKRKLPRWGAILVSYALVLGVLAGFTALVVPRLVAEGRTFKKELPNLQKRLRDDILPAVDKRIQGWAADDSAPTESTHEADDEDDAKDPPSIRITPRPGGGYAVDVDPDVRLRKVGEDAWQIERAEKNKPFSSGAVLRKAFDKAAEYLRGNALELVRIGREVVGALTKGIFYFFLTLMLAAYLMITREKVFGFVKGVFVAPGDARGTETWDKLLARLDRGMAGVVRGQLLICLVNGVLSAIGFWLFGLKYWPILSVVAAVMSLIPIFGSILSSIPAVAIGLTQSPTTGFAVLAWIVGIHQLEANFLNPKIIGDAAKIHPVLVVFSLLVGEHFFQIVGALLAVPVMSIAQAVFITVRERVAGDPPEEIAAPPKAPSPPKKEKNEKKPDVGDARSREKRDVESTLKSSED